MGIKSVHSGSLESKIAYSVEYVDGSKISLAKTDLANLNTKMELDSDLNTKLTLAGKTNAPIFLHKNRNGVIAVATGIEPKIWPEDEKDIT